MRSLALLLCCLLLPYFAYAHTYLSWVSTDGSTQAEGGCVRPIRSRQFPEDPLPLVTGPEMTCGWLPEASMPAAKKCPIAAGGTVTLAWRHNADSATDDIIATTHKGPVLIYLAKSDTGAGPVWFKIYEDGYDPNTGKWAVDKLIDARGVVSAKIPEDIEPGNYLVRGEIFALHNSYDLNGVQPYVGCAELTISGSGTARPDGVAIPGAYTPTDPGLLVNIYQPLTLPYKIPGPPVYKASSKPATSAPTAPTDAATVAPPPKAATSAPINTNPTSAPSNPTSAPSNPTSAPSAPTDSSSSATQVRVQLYPSSSEWWFAATARSTPATTSIEFKDNGPYAASWNALQTTSWGYWTFPATSPIVLPISLRLTSDSGVQLTLDNVFTSWQATTFIDTGKSYSGSNEPAPAQPTQAPPAPATQAPAAPTDAPAAATQAPAAPTEAPAPTTDNNNNNNNNEVDQPIKLRFHEGSSEWWFAVSFTQSTKDITSAEIKDNGRYSEFTALQQQSWGYWTFVTQGSPVAGPITFRLNNDIEFTVPSLSANSEINTNKQFA